MIRNLSRRIFQAFLLGATVFTGLVVFANVAEAGTCSGSICISVSVVSDLPSGYIFPGTGYSVVATVSNSSKSTYSGSVDMYWGYSSPTNGFCSGSYNAPAEGSVTVSCRSSGDSPGTTIYFQANTTGNGNPSWLRTIWSTTSYTSSKYDQSITFSQPSSPATYGSTFTVSPTASSGLTVTVSASGSCSVSGSTVKIESGSGTCTITASQAGNSSYNAATSVSRDVDATKATITVTADNKSKTQGSANPGLTASYSGFVNNETTGNLDEMASLVTTATPGSAVGTYPITPSGAVASNYSFSYVNGTLTVIEAPPNLSPTANISNSSPLPNTTNSYTLSGSMNRTGGPYSGNNCWKLTYLNQSTACWQPAGTGDTVTPYSGSPGDYNNITYSFYLCANDGNGPCSSAVTLKIVKATPVITWGDPSPITYGTALGTTQLNATANVGGEFTYSPVAGTKPNATPASSPMSLSVSFAPYDTTNYNSTTGSVYLTVNKASQTISFAAISNKTLADVDFDPGATGGSSTSGVTYSASPAGVCTIVSGKVHLVGAGTCTVTASQLGDANYNAATSVSQAFTVISNATLNVTSPSNGTISATGISCPTDCSEPYLAGSVATLTATPVQGYAFSSWTGCDTGGANGNVCTATMGSAGTSKTISASFTQLTATINTFSAPEPVVYGWLTFLRWTSTFTSSCTLSGGKYSPPATGQPTSNTGITNNTTGPITSDTTYSLSCAPVSGGAGNPSATFTVHVKPQQVQPTVTMGACSNTPSISVSWPSSNLATSYKLNRSPSGTSGSFWQIPNNTTSLTGLSYNDNSGLTAGTTYYYQLEAVNASGSAFSGIVSATASSPCPPIIVDLTADGGLAGSGGKMRVPYGGSATLRWSSQNAGSCTSNDFATGGSANNASGVNSGSVTSIKKFTLTCSY